MGIRFMRSEISTTGRASSGVKAITLAAGDEVITMLPIEEDDSRAFSLVTTDGVLKRTAITDIPLQGRAGKGVTLIRKRKSNPHQLLAISIEETMYAWTEQHEWSLIDTSQVIVNEQGGIGRTVVEGGLKAIAFETVLPTEESKDDGPAKASGEGASQGGSSQKTPDSQGTLFDE